MICFSVPAVFLFGLFQDTVHVQVKTEPFKKIGHTIKIVSGRTMIDGSIAWGTSGDLPARRTAAIYLVQSRKRVKVPSELYSDCYELDEHERLQVIFDPRKDKVFFKIGGSDGGGSYYLLVTRSAKLWKREISRDGKIRSYATKTVKR